ncbi:hypothetical protein BU17DRAFT_86112 [Hysterangium stoloniferum]|nr:hypothetical protein BU17DRAFT_86112 [Hysterangium stoloniferum]
MAAPTQAYPPWLSPVPTTVTVDGVEVVQTTIVQFPQTYYGPSIPLDSAWIYGGSTFPASIATNFPTSTSDTSSIETSTASIPTSASLSTSAPTPSTLSPTSVTPTPTSTLNTSTSLSVSATTSTAAAPSQPSASTAHGLQASTRLAIILSTVLGFLLLAALAVVLFRICRRKRNGGSLSQSFSSWEIIRQAGGSGGDVEAGEAEVLLPEERVMRHRSGSTPVYAVPWTRPPVPASVPDSSSSYSVTRGSVIRTPVTGSGTGSGTGSRPDSAAPADDSSSSPRGRFGENMSMSTVAASSLFFNPARAPPDNSGSTAEVSVMRGSDEDPVMNLGEGGFAAAVASAVTSSPPRDRDYTVRPVNMPPPVVPPRSPQRPIGAFSNEPVSPSSEDDPIERFLPPRLLDPNRLPRVLQNHPSGDSWPYPESPPSETDERATLLTARRVNVGAPAFVSPIKRTKDLEGWDSPPEDPIHLAPPSARGSTWTDSVVGLAGLARGLGRFSWFKRVEDEAGPSGTRRSSPSRRRSAASGGSKPGSAGGLSFRPASRPHSALFHQGFSRPQSGLSFLGFEGDLGLRSPGLRVSSASASGKTGSGNSGSTVYHSVGSRPQSAGYLPTPVEEGEAVEGVVQLPPDLDLGETEDTIRTIDVLDMPIPERTLPFSAPLLPDATRRSTSSQNSNLRFPPGLVTVSQWDRASRTTPSRQEERDVLEDLPPRAGGEWSSLRSKKSEEETQEGHMPGEQSVQVIAASDGPTSERASLLSGPQHHGEGSGSGNSGVSSNSARSRGNLGFSLTPPMSTLDLADHISHHTGSHSSRPSHHTSRTQLTQHSSREGSEVDEQALRVAASHRASLSPMGGLDSSTPQLPPLRPFSHLPNIMPTTEERRSEEGEADRETGASNSRPGSSHATMSENTFTGTIGSGTAATTIRTVSESIHKYGQAHAAFGDPDTFASNP